MIFTFLRIILLSMIKIKIQEYLRTQAVESAYQLQRILEISPTVAARLWKGDFDKIGINTLDKLCGVFQCQPNDLFEYVRVKGKGEVLPPLDYKAKWELKKEEILREQYKLEREKQTQSDNTQTDKTSDKKKEKRS